MSDNIVVNMIMTPDGTKIRSRHRHDYVSCLDKVTDTAYSVDGGLDYLRRGWATGSPKPIEMSLTLDDPHRTIRQVFDWGTYGKNGDQPLAYILLRDMEEEHIEAILLTQLHISDTIRTVFKNELKYRKGEI